MRGVMEDQGDLGPKADMEPGECEWEVGITAAKEEAAGCREMLKPQEPQVLGKQPTTDSIPRLNPAGSVLLRLGSGGGRSFLEGGSSQRTGGHWVEGSAC